MELDSTDPVTLAICGHLRGRVLNDQSGSLSLTKRALEINRTNPIGWLFRASALYRVNDNYSAAHAAKMAFDTGANTVVEPFVTSVRSYTALGMKDYQNAVLFGERLHASQASFRSNTRVLAAAYGHTGRIDEGRSIVGGECFEGSLVDRLVDGDKTLASHSQIGELAISNGLRVLQ